jgi:hypothetical protein
MFIVQITWQDAETYGDSGWLSLEDAHEAAAKAPPMMQSVGIVLHNDDNYIAITDSMGPNETGHVTKIPKSMIATMTELIHSPEDLHDE